MSYSKVAPDLARFGNAEVLALLTETVPPYTTTNTVFYGTKDFYIVDPATKDSEHQAFLIKHIKNRIVGGHKFLGILLSHHHGDHHGSAELLREQFDAPILAHRLIKAHIEFPIDKEIDEGDELRASKDEVLKIFYTPGHAESHVVFFDTANGLLIAADMITDRGTILIPPNSGSLTLYLQSLERLSYLPIQAVIPAHGVIIKEKAKEFLLIAIKHRLLRIEQIVGVLEENKKISLDATDITHSVYKRQIEENMLFFAQLSVESSLFWLKEHGLAIFHNYRWQLQEHASKEVLLSPLREIDERLGNT